jgi:hypothetical protein
MLSAKDLGLTFNNIEPEIVAYSNASWNQVPVPFGGHVVLYGGVPVPFSAHTTKNAHQPVEAEAATSSKYARHATNIINNRKY